MPQLRFPPLVLIVIIWLAGLGAAAQFAKISIVFSELQQFYNQFGVASGFLLSLISFLGIIFGLIAGLVGARIGYRRLLIIGMALGAAISLLQATMPQFHIMMATRILEGASHLAIVVAAPTLISSIAKPTKQGFALTLWGTFFGVAFAGVALIAPWLMTWGDLPAVFAAHGVYMTLIAAFLMVSLPRIKPVSNHASSLPSFSDIMHLHMSTYASPFTAAPAIGWVFYTLTFVSLITVLPRYIPPEHLIFVVAAMPLASIASSMTMGVFLLRFITATSVIQLGFLCSLVFAIWLGFSPENYILPVALFASLGLVQGASFASVPQINEQIDDRAKGYGAIAQMGNLGNTSGTPLLLLTISLAGLPGAIAFVCVCYVAAIAIHASLAQMRRKALRQ